MEKIYTIMINEAFEDDEPICPFCKIYKKLENNELELILGASMMEPDVRIKTNELGFCDNHYSIMYSRGNRLSLALILESHLEYIRTHLNKLEKIETTCYVCERVEYNLTKVFENAIYLFEADPDFTHKIDRQKYFCLHHFRRFIESGRLHLNKKKFPAFDKIVTGVTLKYFDALRDDVSWFCKKFDYRYENEPWYNAKDAVERALKFLP